MPVVPPEVESPELHDVYQAATLRGYLTNVWRRRQYIWYVSTGELRSRQMTTVLGNVWHLLNPVLQIAVYFVIFGLVLTVDRGVDSFILFLTIGVLVFQFTQKATMEGAKSVVANGGLIRAINFPRAVLPITTTSTETIAMAPGIIVIVIVALATGTDASVRWLAIIPVIGLQTVFNTGAALVAARATSHLRDVEQILPFVFRLLFYASGVIFSIDAYTSKEVQWIFLFNPVFCFVSCARWTIEGGSLGVGLITASLAWAFGSLIVGFVWFRRAEATYGQQ